MTVDRAVAAGLRLRPYLVVDGADAAIELLRRGVRRSGRGRPHPRRRRAGRALRARHRRQRPLPRRRLPRVRHPRPRSGGRGRRCTSRCADADAVVARAAAAGATVLQPVEDRFYGSRSGTIRDPFGHQWQIDAPGRGHRPRTATPRWPTAATPTRPSTSASGHRPTADPHRRRRGQRQAPGVGYFTIDAPDASSGRGVLRRPARAGSPSGSGRGLPHREHLPPGRHRRLGHRARRHVFFRVDDVDAAAARVRELGGTVLEESVNPSGGSARCLDDQGVPFHALAACPRLLKEHPWT